MEKLIYKYHKFIHTLNALERSIKVFLRTDIDDEIRENLTAGIIKHFEMCYESSWKYLKHYLEINCNQIANSPKKIFRECFIFNLLDEQTTEELLNISEARNTTTHTYDQENAQEVCKRIEHYYLTFKKICSISTIKINESLQKLDDQN